MPFVTEELWQRLPHASSRAKSATDSPSANHTRQASHQQATDSDMTSIMVQPYPEAQQSWQNGEVEEQMQIADSIVRAVRKLRNDYGLQRQRPELFIQVANSVFHNLWMSCTCSKMHL